MRMAVWVAALSGLFGLPAAGRGQEGGPNPARYEFAETHMGSEFKILLYSPDAPAARRASRAAFDRIAALDAAFSDYNPESELMKLCDRAGGPPVAVSADLFDILERSRAMYERSGGAFDVTIGPVVRLWRRARRERKLPDPELLRKARALVSSDLMRLDPKARTVRLDKPGMRLDLGGIAKGYAAEAALKVLTAQGVASALVAGAGDIAVSGPPPGEVGWKVAVASLAAEGAAPTRTFLLRDRFVSTSGDAERFVEIGGQRYSHIIDPATGLGRVDRSSVTTLAADGATADALATACYALGPERALPLVESIDGAAALLARQAGPEIRVSESKRLKEIPTAPPSPRSEPGLRSAPAGRTQP